MTVFLIALFLPLANASMFVHDHSSASPELMSFWAWRVNSTGL